MKIFIYKSLIIFFLIIVGFKLTFSYIQKTIERKIDNLGSKENIDIIKETLRNQMKDALEKDAFIKKEDADLINAGKQTITALNGAVYFDSATSFAMIRGKHVQLTVLGAMEVSENGDIANWKIPGKMVKGMGGAMDLVASAENIIVAMMHTNKKGESKLLKKCSLPLTGVACVKKIVTNLAVLEVLPEGGFKLIERAPGVSVEEIQLSTEGKLLVEDDIPEMNFN